MIRQFRKTVTWCSWSSFRLCFFPHGRHGEVKRPRASISRQRRRGESYSSMCGRPAIRSPEKGDGLGNRSLTRKFLRGLPSPGWLWRQWIARRTTSTTFTIRPVPIQVKLRVREWFMPQATSDLFQETLTNVHPLPADGAFLFSAQRRRPATGRVHGRVRY